MRTTLLSSLFVASAEGAGVAEVAGGVDWEALEFEQPERLPS